MCPSAEKAPPIQELVIGASENWKQRKRKRAKIVKRQRYGRKQRGKNRQMKKRKR